MSTWNKYYLFRSNLICFEEVFLPALGCHISGLMTKTRLFWKRWQKADSGFICCANGKTTSFDPLANTENGEPQT